MILNHLNSSNLKNLALKGLTVMNSILVDGSWGLGWWLTNNAVILYAVVLLRNYSLSKVEIRLESEVWYKDDAYVFLFFSVFYFGFSPFPMNSFRYEKSLVTFGSMLCAATKASWYFSDGMAVIAACNVSCVHSKCCHCGQVDIFSRVPPGPWKSSKVLEIKTYKFKALKVLENEGGPWKSLQSPWKWKNFYWLKFLLNFLPYYCEFW